MVHQYFSIWIRRLTLIFRQRLLKCSGLDHVKIILGENICQSQLLSSYKLNSPNKIFAEMRLLLLALSNRISIFKILKINDTRYLRLEIFWDLLIFLKLWETLFIYRMKINYWLKITLAPTSIHEKLSLKMKFLKQTIINSSVVGTDRSIFYNFLNET